MIKSAQPREKPTLAPPETSFPTPTRMVSLDTLPHHLLWLITNHLVAAEGLYRCLRHRAVSHIFNELILRSVACCPDIDWNPRNHHGPSRLKFARLPRRLARVVVRARLSRPEFAGCWMRQSLAMVEEEFRMAETETGRDWTWDELVDAYLTFCHMYFGGDYCLSALYDAVHPVSWRHEMQEASTVGTAVVLGDVTLVTSLLGRHVSRPYPYQDVLIHVFDVACARGGLDVVNAVHAVIKRDWPLHDIAAWTSMDVRRTVQRVAAETNPDAILGRTFGITEEQDVANALRGRNYIVLGSLLGAFCPTSIQQVRALLCLAVRESSYNCFVRIRNHFWRLEPWTTPHFVVAMLQEAVQGGQVAMAQEILRRGQKLIREHLLGLFLSPVDTHQWNVWMQHVWTAATRSHVCILELIHKEGLPVQWDMLAKPIIECGDVPVASYLSKLHVDWRTPRFPHHTDALEYAVDCRWTSLVEHLTKAERIPLRTEQRMVRRSVRRMLRVSSLRDRTMMRTLRHEWRLVEFFMDSHQYATWRERCKALLDDFTPPPPERVWPNPWDDKYWHEMTN
jgi:hypothetical protein